MGRAGLAARVAIVTAFAAACTRTEPGVAPVDAGFDATAVDASMEDALPREAASDAAADTEEVCKRTLEPCASNGECCTASCWNGACSVDAFCGYLDCTFPANYCRTIFDGGNDANPQYECVPMPSACEGGWTCGCVEGHSPCGAIDAGESCTGSSAGVNVNCQQ